MSFNIVNKLDYDYKVQLLFVQAMYNPIFSSEAISYIYENCKKYKINKFEFNDNNKFIEINFKRNDCYNFNIILHNTINNFITYALNSCNLKNILNSIDSITTNELIEAINKNYFNNFDPYRIFNFGYTDNDCIMRIEINR